MTGTVWPQLMSAKEKNLWPLVGLTQELRFVWERYLQKLLKWLEVPAVLETLCLSPPPPKHPCRAIGHQTLVQECYILPAPGGKSFPTELLGIHCPDLGSFMLLSFRYVVQSVLILHLYKIQLSNLAKHHFLNSSNILAELILSWWWCTRHYFQEFWREIHKNDSQTPVWRVPRKSSRWLGGD